MEEAKVEPKISELARAEFDTQRKQAFVNRALDLVKARRSAEVYIRECDDLLQKLDAGEWVNYLPQFMPH